MTTAQALKAMNAEVDENGFTREEREFMSATGARWHNAIPGRRRGFYLPFDFAGLPLTANDRARQERYPWGTFLGVTLAKAKATLESL